MSISNALRNKLGTAYLEKGIFKKPAKEKNVLHHYGTTPNSIHQADTLYLPEDSKTKAKYALVVVDIFTGRTDAEPLRDRTAKEAKRALASIYARNILQAPSYQIQTDPGTEFGSEFHNYVVEQLKINHRKGKVARHRQQAVVESRNKTIGEAIHMRQISREEVTGKSNTDWTRDLKLIIEVINEEVDKQLPKRIERAKKYDDPHDPPKVTESEGELIPIGTKVRIKLDVPIDFVSGKRLHGNFRSSDQRWSNEIHTVSNVILAPNRPPIYHTTDENGKESMVNFTKPQLQIIDKTLRPEAHKIDIDPANKDFQVDQILARERRGNKYFYKVKWVGYPLDQATFEPGSNLPKALVAEFNRR